jgi:adenylylsulfate kinase-like enzyme
MRVLVLTGPPAVGKSTLGRLLAEGRARGALVDIDDVRHMVVSGHAAPWEGDEGRAQRRLGVENGCGLARNFVRDGFDVVVADVVSDETALLYRELLDEPLIVRLVVGYDEAVRRARTRRVFLTWDEFRDLHEREGEASVADHRVDTSGLSAEQVAAEVGALWIT